MHRILFQFGSLTLYSYGFFVAMGFLVSTFLILRESEKAGFSRNDIFDAVIVVLISGLIGARLLFVMINWEYYSQNLSRVLMFYEGGLAFQGGAFFAILAGIVFAWKKKLSFFKGADLIAPYILLGHAVGRIGCFFNGCCYGRPICNGLGVTYPGEAVMRIPVQLYSSFIMLLMFLLLVQIKEKKPFDGFTFAMYLVLYSYHRFFMDFFRGDRLVSFFEFQTLSQSISIFMFFSGVFLYLFLKRKQPHQ